MDIRPFAPGDGASVARLLDQSWGKEPTWRRLYDVHGPARETPTAVRTYVAEGGGEVVGVATALVSVVHFPLRPLVVNVSPEWRRRGVGTRLVEQLGADPAVSGGPSFTRVPTGDEAGLRFSARLGLQPVNRAFGLEIDARSPAVEAWSTAQPAPSELGCTLRRPDQPGWPEAEVLLDFLHDGYRKSHERWTPCPGFPPERGEKFFFSGVQPDSQVVLTRNGDLVAAASLRRDDVFGPDAFHLVFAYAADDAAPPARDLLGTVVAECLRYAARRPQKMVWELHETDTVGLFHAHRLDGRRRVDILLCGPPPGGDLERA